ncbi:U1 small nuclear ribonucleoprotein C [Anabarilius grahami]|uniref:U1 small nuclear ribonucleoprotein C n=1 Tax=Anabarilius grahami TaxID=495550 RepID=A0A3N0XYF8_ANAGA|nr:U1 small nuclear ribonucleoprotein C [Anabarilius grahami]
MRPFEVGKRRQILFQTRGGASARTCSRKQRRKKSHYSTSGGFRPALFRCEDAEPSVRKTHCSGRKHKENVKDYYQKWMEEQAQSLIDKTTAAFQQGKIPPTPFPGAPPPGGSLLPHPNISGPPRPGMLPAPPMGGPPMMPMMGPPPHGMMPGGPGPGMRPPMGGPMQMMPGPHMMRPPARPMMLSVRPGMVRPDR